MAIELLDMNYMIPADCLNPACTRSFFIPDSATKDSAFCPHCGSQDFSIGALSKAQQCLTNQKK